MEKGGSGNEGGWLGHFYEYTCVKIYIIYFGFVCLQTSVHILCTSKNIHVYTRTHIDIQAYKQDRLNGFYLFMFKQVNAWT